MNKAGIVYVAYGDTARGEATMSANALRVHCHLPAAVISDDPLPGLRFIAFNQPGWGARFAKLNLDLLTPFQHTIYMDADTRPRSDPSVLLAPLDDGFDLVIGDSLMQGQKALWHVCREERERTLDAIGFTPVQYQAGLFAFTKNERTAALFGAWRDEWCSSREPTQDQAALLRALNRVPVKLFLFSHCLSEGLIAHLWGRLH